MVSGSGYSLQVDRVDRAQLDRVKVNRAQFTLTFTSDSIFKFS